MNEPLGAVIEPFLASGVHVAEAGSRNGGSFLSEGMAELKRKAASGFVNGMASGGRR